MKFLFLKIKILLNVILYTFLILLILDFFLGKKILDYLDSYLVKTEFYEKRVRIPNKYFHHHLKPNLNYQTQGFNKKIKLCTNNYGFKSSCIKNREIKKFEYGFIGDSFTEGIGLNYEDTFVGIFEKNTNKRVANLGVTSYAPKIYLSKINYYLNQGIEFEHIIIFLDISDYYDEAYYILNKKKNIEHEKKSKIQIFFRKNFPFTNYYIYVLRSLKSNKEKEPAKNVINFNSSALKKTKWLNKNLNEKFENNKTTLEIHNEIRKTLDEIYELLKKNNIKFSLAIYPWPQNLTKNKNTKFYQKEWKEFCFSRCDYFFNFFNFFEEELKKQNYFEVYKKYYFWNDIHFNESGNKLIANELLKKLPR